MIRLGRYAYSDRIVVLLKRLLLVFLLYFVCRLLFFIANRDYFNMVGFGEFLLLCLYGLRFDSFSIAVSDSLFILLSIIPSAVYYRRNYQRLLFWVFALFNSLFLALNLVDAAYFPFIRKRSGSDLLAQVGGQSDMLKLIPRFAVDYWFFLILFALLIWLMMFSYRNIRHNIQPAEAPRMKWPGIVTIMLLVLGLCTIALRGGLQRVPINMMDAAAVAKPETVSLVLNTPFTIIKSLTEKPLERLSYFTEEELGKIYSPLHRYKGPFRKKNLVVIILESFAKEYTRLGRTGSLTPFLDSLMEHSLVFSNAYANGTKSNEGIPAILASIPSLMQDPVINSTYAANRQTSFGTLLKPEGFYCAFMHGGINGTMNFDKWAATNGYDYFGMNEYNRDEDFDQVWGIWDEPFLQYAAEKLNGFPQPFHSAIFTLSSHHPYHVPAKYHGIFKKTRLENAESVQYGDMALRKFFDRIRTMPWYSNTLFVLTADHGSLSEHPFFSNVVGNQSLPVLFFNPDNSLMGEHPRVFSQMDILPSTLNLLGYDKPFFAFGESAFSEEPGNDYFFANSTHYLFGDSLMYAYTLPDMTQACNYKRDSTLSVDARGRHPELDSLYLRKTRAFVQTYNSVMINNTASYTHFTR